MTLSLARRKEIICQVPWITYHDLPTTCTAITSRTPLKAIYSMHGKPPIGLDNYRCKKPAHWRFRALKRSFTRDGDLCWTHLMQSVFGDMAEDERFSRWFHRNYPEDTV